jgi:hypothetical protein
MKRENEIIPIDADNVTFIKCVIRSYVTCMSSRLYFMHLLEVRQRIDTVADVLMYLFGICYIVTLVVSPESVSHGISASVMGIELFLYYIRNRTLHLGFISISKIQKDFEAIVTIYHAVEGYYRKLYEAVCLKGQCAESYTYPDCHNQYYLANKMRRRLSAMIFLIKPFEEYKRLRTKYVKEAIQRVKHADISPKNFGEDKWSEIEKELTSY